MSGESSFRQRRTLLAQLSPTHQRLLASDAEVQKDLQLVLQCSVSTVPQLLHNADEPSVRQKVLPTQRKRATKSPDSFNLDAVLGLATFVCEGESAALEKRPKLTVSKSLVAATKPQTAARPAQTKAPRVRTRTQPTMQYHAPMQSAQAGLLSTYLYPYIDRSPVGLPHPAQNSMYASFAMMNFGLMGSCQTAGYGAWPGRILAPVAGARAVLPHSRVFKRAARHVAIAVFIRTEEARKKATMRGALVPLHR